MNCHNFRCLVFYQGSEHLGQNTQGKSEIKCNIMSATSWSITFAILPEKKSDENPEVFIFPSVFRGDRRCKGQ